MHLTSKHLIQLDLRCVCKDRRSEKKDKTKKELGLRNPVDSVLGSLCAVLSVLSPVRQWMEITVYSNHLLMSPDSRVAFFRLFFPSLFARSSSGGG